MKKIKRDLTILLCVVFMISFMPEALYAAQSTEANSARYSLSIDGIYRSSSVRKDEVATIMLTGDLMCQAGQQKAARKKSGKYSFNDSFYYVKKIFADADFVVGNLETILDETAPYMSEKKFVDGKPNCNAPASYLDALRYAGYDLLTCANNHNCDAGAKGINQTLGHLNEYNFIHTGLFTSNTEPRYVIAEIDGIKVGFVAYSFSFNEKEKYLNEDEKAVMLNAFSPDNVKRDVEACRTAGAEYIIAYNHCGEEYTTKLTDEQKSQVQILADAGVDLVIGSHPHVLQKYSHVYSESGRTVEVMYSMGNFISSMTQHDASKDSIIIKIQLKRNLRGEVELTNKCYIPCRCVTKYAGRNYAVVPITKTRCKTAKIKKKFKKSYNREIKVIGPELPMMQSYKQ